MKEPIRLCDGDELPSALRDAFRALEREAPSAEMVGRVQHALQALPAAPPGVAAVSALSTGKLLALSTILVGTVASFVALRSEPAPISAPPHSQPATVAESATPSVDVPTPLNAESDRGPALTAPAASLERAAPSISTRSSPQAQPEARAAKRSERPGANAPARALAHASSRVSLARGPARFDPSKSGSASPAQLAAPEPTAAPQEAAPAPVNDREAARAASAPDPDAAGAQASEARMLAQAKRLAARDPAAALQQLETLAARHPAGLFVQERELLAIQLHRQLGHTALAEQLARRFQEHYPRSLYRRTLPP